MKKYIKAKSKKSGPNAAGPKYRTSDHFNGSTFSGGKSNISNPRPKFNPAQFKTQHRG